jgi:putative transposase
MESYRVSRRRACQMVELWPRTMRYESVKDPQDGLRIRLKDLAASRVRYGYRRLHVLLLREGWEINHKRVYRIYLQEGLNLRVKRPRRHVAAKNRQERPSAASINERWSMDFMSDQLCDGRWIRVLTIMDNFTRESLAAEVESKFTGHAVTAILARIARDRGCPKSIRVDNGPEFTSRALDQWAYLNKVELDFSRPGKPTDNALIESFNGKLRAECLNQHWFMSLSDAKEKIEAWRKDYNGARPHESLGYLAPNEFVRTSQAKERPERV